MGAVLPVIGTPVYRGSLTITHRAPTPMGEYLELRARVVQKTGRKLRLDVTAEAGGVRFVDASGVFIEVMNFTRPSAVS